MKVLFDTNIVLDLLIDREPFSEEAARLFSICASGYPLKAAEARFTGN